MDFAADAVLDTVTPPARQTTPRAPSSTENEGPSFDDHLDAATREEETAPSTETPAASHQPREQNASDKPVDPSDALLGGAPVAPPAPQVAADTTSAVIVQLIGDAAAPAQPSEAPQAAVAPNAAQAGAPSAPAQSATPAPMQAAANTQDTLAAPAGTAPAPESKPDIATNAVPSEKSATPAPQTAQGAPSAQQPQTIPVTPAAAVTTPAVLAADTAELAAAMVAPVQGQPAPEHAVRQPKAAPAQGEVKPEAAAAPDHTAPTPTIAPRTNGKAAAPQNTAKDAAFTSLLDAPESAPQHQTSSAPASAAAPSTQTQHAVAEQSAARATPAAHQVAREIVRKFDGGNTRFELRLDPPELGRVDVRLDVSRDHRVTAVIAADSPQALTELARHARDLEEMLQGAGLELSDNGLSFDLRQGSSERAETAELTGPIGDGTALAEDAAPPVAARPLGYERWRGVRVDMMV